LKSGLVIRGSRNIFTVRLPDTPALLECRIKGKVLKGVEGFYNPLAPGDLVTVEEEAPPSAAARILAVEPRRNRLTRTRFTRKDLALNPQSASQVLAANVDIVLCITSPASPPFRPRFLDRALAQAEIAPAPAVIVCNKWDLFDGDPDTEERLTDFERIGYRVIKASTKTGEGLEELKKITAGRLSVLVGQSGVGKSSLVNILLPGAETRVGETNRKYDRGNHTTAMSVLFEGNEENAGARLIDTPGIRRLLPDGIEKGDLIYYMKEFSPLAGKCSYGLSCSHRSEPGCKIMEAVHAGVIHSDRYESFLRIEDELA
jgi:ribosome biogenesis GTPase